ncbi:uncharacterized protein RHIMIDRAFT_232997 [Rhizopus microsporus ATCC 52813]|uniref:Uncharacterized protein n=1 Tax=Rhizopus microsporus ATCC 52813 TaxID=1340429 RepID=A0A2G4T982_RHIZD|nr:uncharacterized protein RHIMIDRAFT_232997 [Rhizopus microsporus ATCC 52813]PHZ17569.1 hypothetical protein RHIMIDRAFT_232997 [Rhizopus microsporus ATCC 52813]
MANSTKRPLPPTPSNRKSIIDLSYDTENDILSLQKCLEQKESTINNLKIIVMEWKKKAIEYEAAYNEAKQQLEERERFLMKRHQAEIEALTKAQIDQTNENLDLLLKLENENKQLKQQLQNSPTKEEYQLPIPPVAPFVSNTSQLCNTAEVANQTATASVIKSRKQSNELVERINEMMSAMEGTLHGIKDSYGQTVMEDTTPPLISDLSSSEEEYDAQSIEIIPKATSSKKRLSSFFFGSKHKKDDMFVEKKKTVFKVPSNK